MELLTPEEKASRKNHLREKIWKEVDQFVTGPKPVQGRIPNFKGSKAAADNLISTLEFHNAKVVKVHPSLNAIPLREQVLRSDKILLVPPLPGHDFLYFQVNAKTVRNQKFNWAAQKRGFNRIGIPLDLKDIPKIDLFVVAATVVSSEGCRAGKGKGYGEVEWGIVSELGVVDSNTTVATIVHDSQVVDSHSFPSDLMESHDLPIDIIATPTRVIRCQYNQNKETECHASKYTLLKPKGILWDKIDDNMLNDIGALKSLKLKLSTNK